MTDAVAGFRQLGRGTSRKGRTDVLRLPLLIAAGHGSRRILESHTHQGTHDFDDGGLNQSLLRAALRRISTTPRAAYRRAGRRTRARWREYERAGPLLTAAA